jgi:hypothetical protein
MYEKNLQELRKVMDSQRKNNILPIKGALKFEKK